MPAQIRNLLLIASIVLTAFAQAAGPYAGPTEMDLRTLDSLATAGMAADSTKVKGENMRLISSGLSVVLGPFGAHRLYLGTSTRVAVVYGVTFGGFGILALLDLAHLLFTKDLQPYRNNDRVFMWGKAAKEPIPQ